MAWSPCLAVATVLVACGRTPVWIPASDTAGEDAGETDPQGPGATSTTGSGSSTGEYPCDPVSGLCPIELTLQRAADILFVVDNSGSMGGEQGTLAQSFRSFIEVLEAQQVGANYRIGITTSDGSGLLRATSCRSRIHEFLFEWQFGSIDERQRGCLDHCAYETLAIAQPWVEKSAGATNLPNGVDMASALQCIGPQGINGPGFERPLESMLAAIEDPGSTFLRDEALFAVIFLTDEADCSTTDENELWLQTQGTVFWTTPDRSTSAVCWNAGVTCLGGPSPYDTCFAQDKDFAGLPTAYAHEAVLLPVQRYVEALAALAQHKQTRGSQGQVLLALIAGVPIDYPQAQQIPYADSIFDDFNLEYGIGPGCDIGSETIHDPPGIPPVRLREVARSFATEENNIFSICDDDYGIALEQIAAAIGEMSERACVTGCVADIKEKTAGLQPSCTLTERFAPETGLPDRPVPPCVMFGETWDFPGDDVHACYRALVDDGGDTPTPIDDMSAQCVTLGFNLELVVERRADVPVPAGTAVDVHCDLLAPPGVLCQNV